jgi:hypothetical protein
VSDASEKPRDEGGWVPSAEHPVPPTTEFQAIDPDAVEPIDGPTTPDEEPAEPEAATTGSAPQETAAPTVDAAAPDAASPADTTSPADAAPADATLSHPIVTPKPDADDAATATTPAPAADADPTPPPVTPAAPQAGASATGTPPRTEAPSWKTPAAAGLPPQWGDPDAQAAAAQTGPQPTNGIENLWGLAPEDRPEVLLGAALAGGVVAAILVRSLARR